MFKWRRRILGAIAISMKLLLVIIFLCICNWHIPLSGLMRGGGRKGCPLGKLLGATRG